MSAVEQDDGGAMTSVRRLGRSLLGLVRTRMELFALEVQEEKLRLVSLLVWSAVAVALGVAGVLLAVGVLALFAWQTSGYWGLIGLATAVLAAAAGLLWFLRRRILRGPTPFAQTVEEFRKDADLLRPPP